MTGFSLGLTMPSTLVSFFLVSAVLLSTSKLQRKLLLQLKTMLSRVSATSLTGIRTKPFNYSGSIDKLDTRV